MKESHVHASKCRNGSTANDECEILETMTESCRHCNHLTEFSFLFVWPLLFMIAISEMREYKLMPEGLKKMKKKYTSLFANSRKLSTLILHEPTKY